MKNIVIPKPITEGDISLHDVSMSIRAYKPLVRHLGLPGLSDVAMLLVEVGADKVLLIDTNLEEGKQNKKLVIKKTYEEIYELLKEFDLAFAMSREDAMGIINQKKIELKANPLLSNVEGLDSRAKTALDRIKVKRLSDIASLSLSDNGHVLFKVDKNTDTRRAVAGLGLSTIDVIQKSLERYGLSFDMDEKEVLSILYKEK
ncbi:MAG TPA: hypothetical protein VGE63_02210 [Candidatus Paceibacterota bacterium]